MNSKFSKFCQLQACDTNSVISNLNIPSLRRKLNVNFWTSGTQTFSRSGFNNIKGCRDFPRSDARLSVTSFRKLKSEARKSTSTLPFVAFRTPLLRIMWVRPNERFAALFPAFYYANILSLAEPLCTAFLLSFYGRWKCKVHMTYCTIIYSLFPSLKRPSPARSTPPRENLVIIKRNERRITKSDLNLMSSHINLIYRGRGMGRSGRGFLRSFEKRISIKHT